MSEITITIGRWSTEQQQCDVYAGRNADGEGITTVPVGNTGWLGAGDRFRPCENPDPNHLVDTVEGWIGTDRPRTREGGIELYFRYLMSRSDSDPQFRDALVSLDGHTLGCSCRRIDQIPAHDHQPRSDPESPARLTPSSTEPDWCHCDAIDLAIRSVSDNYDNPHSTVLCPSCESTVVSHTWVEHNQFASYPHSSELRCGGNWEFQCDCGEEFELIRGPCRWKYSRKRLDAQFPDFTPRRVPWDPTDPPHCPEIDHSEKTDFAIF